MVYDIRCVNSNTLERSYVGHPYRRPEGLTGDLQVPDLSTQRFRSSPQLLPLPPWVRVWPRRRHNSNVYATPDLCEHSSRHVGGAGTRSPYGLSPPPNMVLPWGHRPLMWLRFLRD